MNPLTPSPRAPTISYTNPRGHRRGRPSKPIPPALRELRVTAGLTVAGLSRASGVHPATLSQIEHGRRIATHAEANAIARALDLPAGSLAIRTMLVYERQA